LPTDAYSKSASKLHPFFLLKNKPLINYIAEDAKFKDDFLGNLTICNVPHSLLREFMRTVVWPKYPGGISEALQDLIRKEVQKQKKLDALQP
jgi:hypothetical protein